MLSTIYGGEDSFLLINLKFKQMETKKAKVIMLPTEDISQITLNTYINETHNCSNLQFNLKPKFNNEDAKSMGFEYQHIYIITDDEIKEGDWFVQIHQGNKSVVLCDKQNKNVVNTHQSQVLKAFKIIATTDKLLTINKTIYKETQGVKMRGDYLQSLPQPSQAFIEKYCGLGGIDEVLLEYGGNVIEFQNFCSDLGFSYDSTFGWYENANPGHRPNTSTLEEKFNNKLKVDPIHNTVTIHPIKKSWTKKEITELLLKYSNLQYKTPMNSKYVSDWVKKNL